MSSFGSVTRWLNQLQGGDRAAVQKLWEGYFARLVVLARKRLRDFPPRAADEEDVALSAFDSFCRGAEQGRFPRLEDRDDLWQVLVMITARKACDLKEHEGRAKRDWRRTKAAGESPAADESYFPELIGRAPDPAFAAQVAEEYQRLLDGLPDDLERKIVELKLAGHTNEEIAGILKEERKRGSLSMVERKLALIRKRWEQELPA